MRVSHHCAARIDRDSLARHATADRTIGIEVYSGTLDGLQCRFAAVEAERSYRFALQLSDVGMVVFDCAPRSVDPLRATDSRSGKV